MNSKKLWHAFGILFAYLIVTALLAVETAKLFVRWHCGWGVPFTIGTILWLISLVVLLVLMKNSHLSDSLALLIFPINVAASGFLIAAFIVGKNDLAQPSSILLMATLVACCYLLLMAFLTVPSLKDRVWYQIVCYIIWMVGNVFLCSFLFDVFAAVFSLAIPAERSMLFLFFFILLGLLAIGTLLSSDNFKELLSTMILPAMIATFLIAIIVLLALAGGDGCDGCDCGGEACDCSGGKHNATKYGGMNKKSRNTTLSELSSGKWT